MEPQIDTTRIHQETLFSQTFRYLETNCNAADRNISLLLGKIHLFKETDFSAFDKGQGIIVSRFVDDLEKMLHVFQSLYIVIQENFFPEIENVKGLGIANQIGFEQVRFLSILNNLDSLSDEEFFAIVEAEVQSLHGVVEENSGTLALAMTHEDQKEQKILLKDLLEESYLAGLSGTFLVDAVKKWSQNKLKNKK